MVSQKGTTSADIAELMESQTPEDQIATFRMLNPRRAVKVFEYLPFRIQKEILQELPADQIANLMNSLAPDDRTTLLQELPADVVNLLLKFLTPEERALSVKLLGYPEDSVGRLMTPDYIAIKLDWTIRQALNFIRENGKDSETLNVIYAIDDKGILIDDFRIREFLLAPLDSKIQELADYKFLSLNVDDTKETAINMFRKYDRVALPVIDAKGVLLGIVTIDDIIEVAVEEDTNDMQMIGGQTALKEPYMEIPFFSLINKRIGWLILLFLGEMLTTSAMGYYQDEISKAVVLALFIPLIISSGGNAGSQATTLIVRAIALGEVKFKDGWRIMRREILSGLVLGCALGLIGFFRVFLWGHYSDIYGDHSLLVAITIFITILGVVLWGTLVGAMLPLALKKMGFDPAVSSAPFVATLVDVTGLVIYFSIAMIVLQGTLL